jgi:hypothetical protein
MEPINPNSLISLLSDLINLKTELSTKDNGVTVKDKEKELNHGLMEVSMKDIGKIIKLMEKVD